MIGPWLAGCFTWVVLGLCPPQDPVDEPGVSQARPEYFRVMRFLDASDDRRIDPGEFASGQQLASIMLTLSWSDCDQDGDGSVSLSEFQSAAGQAAQGLAESDSAVDDQASEDLARAVPLSLLLERLSEDERYVEEVAELREAIEDLDDDDAVVTYITKYAKHYPRLYPAVRTWGRHYPVRPAVRRHFKTLPAPVHRSPAAVKPADAHQRPKAPVKTAAPAAKAGARSAKPATKKPAAKPGPKRGGGRP
ncbi:MAG: hypothetical protein KKB50_17765 [Planctomycetes bacterium]|nr:hypothetical protein [Planctomycetota bacterium]